jgi:hypothetical protein
MSSFKKIYQERDFTAGICLSEAQNPILSPTRSHCILVYLYSVLIHTGKGGGRRAEPERRGEGQQFTKLDRMTD